MSNFSQAFANRNKPISNQRITNLDILRAIAALMVCLVHFLRKPLYEGTLIWDIFQYGKYGVDIFFVISGFVIPLSLLKCRFKIGDIFLFLKSRFIRLYPAYFIAAFLTTGMWYFSYLMPGFRGEVGAPLGIERILANISLTCGFFHQEWYAFVAWSLAIEAQYYVLVALSFPLLIHRSPQIRISILFMWMIAPLAAQTGPTVFSYTALFGMGILAFLLSEGLLSKIEFWILMSLAVCVEWVTDRGPAGTLFALATSMAILYLPKLKIPSMAWIGAISYSIYLLHVPFGGRVMNLLERFPNFPGIKLFSIPVAIGVSIVVAAVFYKFIEKPSHQFSRYIKQKSLTDI